MVGIFSRFSIGHRRTQSAAAMEENMMIPPPPPPPVAQVLPLPPTGHGIIETAAVEFKPVEHPMEPINRDEPVQCPLPEPSILNDLPYNIVFAIALLYAVRLKVFGILVAVGFNSYSKKYSNPVGVNFPDGRIWKERRTSLNSRVRADLPVVREDGSQLDSEADVAKLQTAPPKRHILPSISAPELNLINLLEECGASGDQNVG